MKLVIVESPHKCITIKKYLGAEYEVMASVGHLVDLSTSGTGGFGIEPEKGAFDQIKVPSEPKPIVEEKSIPISKPVVAPVVHVAPAVKFENKSLTYAKLDEIVELAFDDQCTGANPAYPLMEEIKQIYIDAYNGVV